MNVLSVMVAVSMLVPSVRLCAATPVVEFDFTRPGSASGWTAQHDISALRATPEGLEVTITGMDPYLAGPARDYPPGQALWLSLRVKSEEGGGGQVFFFQSGTAPTEPASVHFDVNAGEWTDLRVPLPPLGPRFHLRIDPPGTTGQTLLARLQAEPRVLHPAPRWPKPALVETVNARRMVSGDLTVAVAPRGGFRLEVEGTDMGQSYDQSMVGYQSGDELRWFELDRPEVTGDSRRLTVAARGTDPDGARWTCTRTFTPGNVAGTIEVETRVTVDRERSVLHLPMLLVLPGAGAFGTNKHQGLFAGLEYLDNEPSSSEADLRGPASHRQTPARHKITFPLMAVQAQDRYVGLAWDQAPQFTALFDSPDRLFDSGGHVMGVIFPGSDGKNRVEGSLLPYFAEKLSPNQPLTLRAQLLGGHGRSVVAAVQHYVRLRGWPEVPPTGYSLAQYAALTAHGWLDSKIREGNLFRHAVWGDSFRPAQAADAAMYMDWLAGVSPDAPLAERLRQTRTQVLQGIAPDRLNSAAVGHVRTHAPALVYGHVPENADLARTHGRQLLGVFQSDGSILYHKPASGPDYGSTHFAREANGLTAQTVQTLLENAVFSGDRALIAQALTKLRALDKFRDSVPRGAQTWEIPLHTPDILASAYLVHAYTLGYELTGEQDFLDQAIYWAWTGVPFVYLTHPTGKGIGPYSTIAVLGATAWVAPVWMGLPVQWCGMVYADALNRLAPYDPATPWRRIADGISAAGVQITWPLADKERGGLLPDGFELVSQRRNGPAINPGTVQAGAVPLYGQGPLYGFHAFRRHAWLVHAPGQITAAQETATGVRFEVRVWPKAPCYVLINGFTNVPTVKLNGQPCPLTAPHQFQPDPGRLVLQVSGPTRIEVDP